MNWNITDKQVLVTGGTSGIGRATAAQLARQAPIRCQRMGPIKPPPQPPVQPRMAQPRPVRPGLDRPKAPLRAAPDPQPQVQRLPVKGAPGIIVQRDPPRRI